MPTPLLMQSKLSVCSFLKHYCPFKENRSKRIFDIFFSAFVLIIFSPLFLLIIGLVKISSPGPIFYPSLRVGVQGKTIYCWKFRTMHQNADAVLYKILETDPALKEEWSLHFKLKKDPRITKIGSFLRKSSLDELPQFWNILKGDLSTVGPRPISEKEAEIVVEKKLWVMFSVRPGLTGLWQTSGRSHIPFDKRIAIEARYAKERSFLGDFMIIAKTIPALIYDRGAY